MYLAVVACITYYGLDVKISNSRIDWCLLFCFILTLQGLTGATGEPGEPGDVGEPVSSADYVVSI